MEPCRCSCLIPFHDEGERILAVVDAVARAGAIDQIVCVDDGSTDDGGERLRRRHPRVEVLRLEQNRGKCGAVAHGLGHVRHEYVLLLDGDLLGVRPEELDRAIEAVMADRSIDMIILNHVRDWTVRLLRASVLMSGDRVLRKGDLERALASGPTGYQLEMAINAYMMRHGKKVFWLPSSSINVYGLSKRGLRWALKKEIGMTVRDVLGYAGPRHYLRQLLTFCRDRAPTG